MIDNFGLYMKSADYNELCVTDNGDIYIMTSDFIARLGYDDGKFRVEKYNELTALDDFADGNVVPVERSPQVMRGYLRRLPDGGAAHFAKTIRAIRARCPGTTMKCCRTLKYCPIQAKIRRYFHRTAVYGRLTSSVSIVPTRPEMTKTGRLNSRE